MRSHLEHALAMNQLLHFPEELERIIGPSARSYDYGHDENKGMEPAAVDIKETAKGYVFYADVPGLTKSDIQVFVEEEKMLVIKCQGGKRKRKEVEEEENCIIQLHALLGNRWSAIATHLPKRTDNEIKNYWNTHLKKRLLQMGIDPVTH